MRDKIKAGFFGHRITISIFEGDITKWPTQSGYTFRKNLVPGGLLFNNGIHSIDFMLWCLGQPIDFEYYDDSIGGLESNAEVKINFGNDCRGYLRLSRTCRLQNKILVKGEKTAASMGVYEMNRIYGNDDIRLWGSQLSGKAGQDNSSIALLQLQDFISALHKTDTPPCSGEEGAAVIDLIEQCYTLKRNRSRPDLTPIPGLMW
jgi:predicted dehydrogenase